MERFALGLAIQLHDDTVEEAVPGEQGVAELRLVSRRSMSADLFVDCSGIRSARQSFWRTMRDAAASAYALSWQY